MDIEKNNNTRTVQAESSIFASLSFDQGFQIVIPPRIVANVPEPIRTPSDAILHQSNSCLLGHFSSVFLDQSLFERLVKETVAGQKQVIHI